MITEAMKQKLAEGLDQYELVKERLFLKLRNRRQMEDQLAKIPYEPFWEFVVTCHIDMTDRTGCASSVTVTNGLLDAYGIPKEQLFSDAIKAAQKVRPVRTGMIEDFVPLGLLSGGLEGLPEEARLRMITTENTQYGAAAILYPGALQKLAGGRDLFLIPSSIHEWLLLRDGLVDDPADLENLIQDVNRSWLSPEDVLSDQLYYYDCEKDEVRTWKDQVRPWKEENIPKSVV